MQKIYGVKEIIKIMPQRNPMLLLDRAQEIDEKNWVGVKNVSMDVINYNNLPFQQQSKQYQRNVLKIFIN